MKLRIFVETTYVFDADKYVNQMVKEGVDTYDPEAVYTWLIDHCEEDLCTDETYDDETNSRPAIFED